jgi:cell wall-associated NlpC family hydrolase
MRTRLRRLLLAFAVFASALALPPATSWTQGVGSWVSVAAAGHPEVRAPRNAGEFMARETQAATLALRMAGTPYRWGGESPEGGFDCSGLIRWAYGQVGIELPHNSQALYSVGHIVPRTRLRTGDLLFFSGLGHVGLYLGGGLMVHAPYSGKSVEVVELAATNYGRRLVGARRVVTS